MLFFSAGGRSKYRCSGYAVQMAVIRNKDGLHGGIFRSRLIIGLMALILLLVLGMAWQANRSVQAHNETAIGVLKDYARLAADEFARRAMGAVGYYGYYAVMNDLRAIAAQDPEGLTAQVDQGDSSVEPLSLYVFSVRVAEGRLSTSSPHEPRAAVREHLLLDRSLLVNDPMPEMGFVVEHAAIDGEQHSFVVSWTEDRSLIFGIEVNQQWLPGVLQQTFDENVLLPASLAGGAVTNDQLFIRLDDSVGRTLFVTGDNDYYVTLVSVELLEQYGGVLRGHTVSAAIAPGLAQSLIIGGLPKSRLPVIVAVILLAIGLLLAAIRQLQRENAVMQMRTNFVAEVSHELRTPLTQIRMFTESLLFERLRSNDDKLRALSIINRESQRLIHMVENILRFSEGGQSRDKLALQVQDLEPVIRSVVEEFQVLADAAEAQVDTVVQADVVANVDADAIRQVLLNLLDNAIKYGPQGQTIKVELFGESDKACIAIEDQGPGIPMAERQRIWGAYYRLERERESAIAGTGIGLAVVAELIDKHGGTVRVADSESGGARFVIELPL